MRGIMTAHFKWPESQGFQIGNRRTFIIRILVIPVLSARFVQTVPKKVRNSKCVARSISLKRTTTTYNNDNFHYSRTSSNIEGAIDN